MYAQQLPKRSTPDVEHRSNPPKASALHVKVDGKLEQGVQAFVSLPGRLLWSVFDAVLFQRKDPFRETPQDGQKY
jgi:hypothetical protein